MALASWELSMSDSTVAPIKRAPMSRAQKITKCCEWFGSLAGLTGATLVALKSDYAGYGFVAFLASNVGWISYSMRTRTWSLFLMQLGFTATSLIGIKNWL